MEIMKYSKLFFGISLVLLTISVFSLLRFGLQPSVDFAGGSLLEIELTNERKIETMMLREMFRDTVDIASVQDIDSNRFVIKTSELDNQAKDLFVEHLEEEFGAINVLRFQTVGASVSQELIRKTFFAIITVAVLITTYVWHQFKDFKFGISAILAMLHDTVILLGSFSLFGYFLDVEVDVLFVSAVLTTLSFSVHDTIVVYDRIRELRNKHAKVDMTTLVNTAVLETMSRSLNNSITVFIVLVSLVLLGGVTIKWFAVALLIGAVVGTYSSTFVAAPLLVVWEELDARQSQRKKKK